jgi:hypothetical protein
MTKRSEFMENWAEEYEVDLLNLLSLTIVPILVLAHFPKFLVLIELERESLWLFLFFYS